MQRGDAEVGHADPIGAGGDVTGGRRERAADRTREFLGRLGPTNRIERQLIRAVLEHDEYDLTSGPPLGPEDVVIDVGAHLGAFAFLAHALGAGRVVAFEPAIDNFVRARRALEGLPGVTIENCAVFRSDLPQGVQVRVSAPDGENTGGRTIVFGGDGFELDAQRVVRDPPAEQTVPTVALDEVLQRWARVALLKLDCEGSEFPVLLTARELGRVERIVGEYHEVTTTAMHALSENARVGGVEAYVASALARSLERRRFRVELHPDGSHIGRFRAIRRSRAGLRLATAARAAVLAIAVVCAVMLAAFAWSPSTIDRLGDALVERARSRELRAAERYAGAAAVGPAIEHAVLSDWVAEHPNVRKLDRLAPAAAFVDSRLVALARGAGDTDAAIVHARRWVARDDRDVDAIAALGVLLGAAPPTRDQAIDLLHRAWRCAPDVLDLAVPLGELLARGDRHDEAAAVITAACRGEFAGTWRVQWGEDVRCASWFVPRRLADGRIEARFTILDEVDRLVFTLPAFATQELTATGIAIGEEPAVPLDDLRPHLVGIRRSGDALILDGVAHSIITIPLDVARPGPVPIVLRTRPRAIVGSRMRELVLGELGARIAAAAPSAALTLVRARALQSCVLDVVGGGRRSRHPLEATCSTEGARFDLRVTLPPAAEGLRIELPAGVFVCYQDLVVTVLGTDGERHAQLQPAEAHTAVDVAIDGSRTEVTGPAPSMGWSLPRGSVSVRIEGVAR